MRQKTTEELFSIIEPVLKDENLLTEKRDKNFYLHVFEHAKDYFVLLSDIVPYLKQIFSYDGIQEERLSEVQNEEMIRLIPELISAFSSDDEEWTPEFMLKAIRTAGKQSKVKGKALWKSLRVMITNEDEGPEIYLVIYMMGKEKVIQILQRVLNSQ